MKKSSKKKNKYSKLYTRIFVVVCLGIFLLFISAYLKYQRISHDKSYCTVMIEIFDLKSKIEVVKKQQINGYASMPSNADELAVLKSELETLEKQLVEANKKLENLK